MSALQKWLAEESLSHLTLRGDEQDLGCGDGRVTAELALRLPGGSVLGVDASPLMVEHARLHHQAGNLTFEQGDARSFRTSPRDVVVSFNALHWVVESEFPHALETVRMALLPTGRAHLRFVAEGPTVSLEDVLEQVRQSERWRKYFTDYRKPFCHPTQDQCRDWAEQAGMRVAGCTVSQKTWDFGSEEGFAHFGGATFVDWSSHVPEEERPAFVADVLHSYSSPQVFTFYQMQLDLVPQ